MTVETKGATALLCADAMYFTSQYLKSTITQYFYHRIKKHRFPIVKVRYFEILPEVDLTLNSPFQTRKRKAQKGSQNDIVL